MEDTKSSSSTAQPTEPEKTLYNRSLFDPELRGSRNLLIKTLALPIVYNSLLMWGCLSLYWGSTVSSNLNKLTVYAIDLDGGEFGQQMLQGINASIQDPARSLGWHFDARVTSAAASKDLVLNEQAWAVVQSTATIDPHIFQMLTRAVNPEATSSLQLALRTGSTSYSSLSAMTIYTASARNQITTNSKVTPAIIAVVNPLLAKLGAQSTGKFLSSHARNATAIQAALRCRGCLSSPYAAQQVDLLPFDVPEAMGSTMVGLIFLLTFTFSIFQILHINGDLIGSQLNLQSALFFRTVSALLSYLAISLWYTLINLAFSVPITRKFGHGGFMVYWMLNFCTMAALGLPMESLFTLIGLKWAGYFLSFWIIVNVAGSFTSFELMPGFYTYGYGFAFFNSIQGARTILFGTKNHLGRNFSILIAWMVAGLVGISVFTAWTLKQNQRKRQHVLR